jgi:hypothetical protein
VVIRDVESNKSTEYTLITHNEAVPIRGHGGVYLFLLFAKIQPRREDPRIGTNSLKIFEG